MTLILKLLINLNVFTRHIIVKLTYTKSFYNEKEMKMKNSLLLCLILIYSTNVYAYIDPGSGSALITAILGFFAAIIYSFKKFFYNLKNKFKSESKSNSKKD